MIFNHYISLGRYPEAMKIAKVIPLFKKGNRSLSSNYRPISLLSTFNKIFERIISRNLINFLEYHSILFMFQFGFRKLFSTTLALIEITDKIRSLVDEGNYISLVLSEIAL